MDLKDLQKILEKMDLKQDTNHKETQEKFRSIDATLIKNTQSLIEHVRRTNLLEKEVHKTNVEVKAISTHVTKVQFAVTSFKWLSSIGGISLVVYLIKTIAG